MSVGCHALSVCIIVFIYSGDLQQIAIKICTVWYICSLENYKVTPIYILRGFPRYRRIRKQTQLVGPIGREIKWPRAQ